VRVSYTARAAAMDEMFVLAEIPMVVFLY